MSDLTPAQHTPAGGDSPRHSRGEPDFASEDDVIDLRDLVFRILRGLPQMLGFAALGLAVASLGWLIASPFQSETTSARVAFSFTGSTNGEYPDHSTFRPNDLGAPDVVAAALQRLRLDSSSDVQSKVRAALAVEGIIPADAVKEHDRLLAAGQTPPAYVPEEFAVSLSLPRRFPMDRRQRELFLEALVTAYREKFQATYEGVPSTFGNLQDVLANADFQDYEQILSGAIGSIQDYLTTLSGDAPTFRSQNTNLSFNDLLKECRLFADVYMNETLGYIRMSSLSRNPDVALLKMNYQLQVLADDERQAAAEERTTRDLLAQAETHSVNYVLGAKSQDERVQGSASPILDQGLVNSLMANDTYGYMMRQTLAASLKVKGIQSEEGRVTDRRAALIKTIQARDPAEEGLLGKVVKSVKVLNGAYTQLMSDITATYADYARQQFADVVRVTMEPMSPSKYKPLAVAGAVGGFIGLAIGGALSLLGVYVGEKQRGSGQKCLGGASQPVIPT